MRLCYIKSFHHCIDLGRKDEPMKSVKARLLALLLLLAVVLSGCYVDPNNAVNNNQNGNLNFPTYPGGTEEPVSRATELPTDTPVTPIEPSQTEQAVATAPPSGGYGYVTVGPMITSSIGTQPQGSVTPIPAPTPKPTATPFTSLKLGSQGQDVRNVQQKLKQLGFLKGNVDGDFGKATEEAVKAFQKQYGLEVDGKVGVNTLAKLQTARATMKPAVTATPKKTATPKPNYNSNTYLRNGDESSQVRSMQNRLIELGYLVGKATAKFDNGTEAAVIAFQRRNTRYADGVAGPETLKALYSSSAAKTSSPSGIVGLSLREGSKETAAVRLMQQKLKKLGYYRGNVDGSFGSGTTDAVKSFQRANGLTADGVAGGGTLNRLFSGSAKSSSQAAATATPKPTAVPRPTLKPTPSPIPPNIYVLVTPAPYGTYPTLRRGMYGSPVQEMQQALQNQGYYFGSADGYFGEGTENAVRSFQRTNGLDVDGVAGPATLRTLLYGPYPYGS